MRAATVSLTFTNTQSGYQTIPYPGVCNGIGRWNTNDIKDLGMNTIRWWTGFYNFAPVDPDGVYGKNTPAQIKANPNLINWSAYATQFNRTDPYFYDTGYTNAMTGVSMAQMIQDCKNNGLEVMLGLETHMSTGEPAWLTKIPVRDTASRNEVWEFAFAMVYYTNVLNDWRVDHWGVENEPDATTEAWRSLGGTMAEYYQYLSICRDAIDYVYNTYLGGRTHYVHGPVSSDYVYCEPALQQADADFNVVDYHRYYDMLQLADVWGWIQQNNSDGFLEPIWLSEWGLLYDQYDFTNSMMEIGYFYEMETVTRGHVLGSHLYSLSPWIYPGPWTSPYLIADNGSKTEMYHAVKTFLTAAGRGRDVYNVTGSAPANSQILATKDANNIYFLVINQSGTTNTINLNVSAHVSSGTASVMEWSSSYKATVSQTPAVNSGTVSITSRGQSVIAVTIPLSGTTPTPTPTPGSNELAQGKTASTDSYYPGYEASKGNDGNTSTLWCANDGNTNHWWKVDLDASKSITSTQVNWEATAVYKYKIEVSTDNTNWTLKVDKTGNTSSAQTQTDNFTATARYVRITVTGLTGGNWASFSEFKVFGS